MIIQGKINRILGVGVYSVVEFEVLTYQASYLTLLDKDELYSLNIKKATSKKSLNQNNYAWALMTEIAKELDAFPKPIDVYLTILKMAKIKTHFLQILDLEPDAEGNSPLLALERSFRAVRVVERNTNDKGNKVLTVEVSEGMSRFNKEQMSQFIDRLIYFADMNNIDTSNYKFER